MPLQSLFAINRNARNWESLYRTPEIQHSMNFIGFGIPM